MMITISSPSLTSGVLLQVPRQVLLPRRGVLAEVALVLFHNINVGALHVLLQL